MILNGVNNLNLNNRDLYINKNNSQIPAANSGLIDFGADKIGSNNSDSFSFNGISSILSQNQSIENNQKAGITNPSIDEIKGSNFSGRVKPVQAENKNAGLSDRLANFDSPLNRPEERTSEKGQNIFLLA